MYKALEGLLLNTFNGSGSSSSVAVVPEFEVAAQIGKQVNGPGDCGKIYAKCQRLSVTNTVV